MGWRFLLICVAAAACVRLASAQEPLEDLPPSPTFAPPVLEQPPREEIGPLDKKLQDRRTPESDAADAAPPTNTVDFNAVQPAAPADGTRLRGYVDGVMAALIAAGEIPGATVLIIQDGKVALKAGYGYADIRAHTRVDPDRTRFRVASISKVVTATAVMQLVEGGRIDLNADVNTYLAGFKIAPTYPEPVTLSHILTHTAGFDDRYLGIGAPMSQMIEPLGQYLARSMPPRVLPPGKTFLYSNHAYGLAGHIVESVSGQEFNAYVQTSIFDPLKMQASTFGVPYPLPQDIAVPYFKGGNEGGFTRGELDRVRFGPAGDLLTTAGDMAQFMLAHLGKGTLGDEQILAEQTAERMHAEHFSQIEGLDGWAYGFMEGQRNGVRWLGHDGSWIGFCAQLVMVPETKSGFFVAYNADCHFTASAPIRKTLFDLLWPPKTEVVADTAPTSELRARSVVGTYMAVRRARGDFTIMGAAATQMKVTAPGDGRLSVLIPSAGREFLFLPQANGTWINPDFGWKAAALADGRGQAMQFVVESNVYDRVVGAGEWALWSIALAVVIGLCLMAIWGWTSGFLSRQFFGEPQAVITFLPRITAFLAAGLTIASLVTMAALLSDDAPLSILHGPTPMLMVLLSVPVAVAVLAVPMVIWSMTGFGDGNRARTAQVGYAILTIAILVFVAFAWQWGLHPFAFAP